MRKYTIQNRKGQAIAIILDESDTPKGLAFVMHGLGGRKEEPHIQTFAAAFQDNGFTVVRFDTTNSVGESGGNLVDATLTSSYEDLEDVIGWAATQSWYQEPFILAGHSLGGISSALFAQKYPEKVKALAPISAVVSGALTEVSPEFQAIAADWQKNGIREWQSNSQPGVVKRLKWSHVEDRRKYDLLPQAAKLTMPVLMIVGELDDVTPPEHQQMLYDRLPGEKELHIIKGSYHTFRDQQHLDEIRTIFINWIKHNDL
jgi:pimeloyl-ACP methyl ester carboxylesterase